VRLTKSVIIRRQGFQPLPPRMLLRNARILDPGQKLDTHGDILIEDGKIVEVGTVPSQSFEGEILDLDGKVVTPGWLDMHVHLREPGREDEETIESGTLAAANGGFTAVCCMPNTQPPIDNQEIIQYILDRSRDLLVTVYPIATITKGRNGEELAEILELVEQGAVAISDDGRPVMRAEVMRRALEYARMANVPVIAHEEDVTMSQGGHMHEGFVSTCLGLGGIPSVAEDIMVARDIMLAEYTGGRLHVAHVSSAGAVALIRQARDRGIQVTAEVTTHHLILTDEAVRSYDTNTKVNPPLRTEADRQALIQALQDGTIDCIVTDHAPHSWEEKEAEYVKAPFGVVGLETAMGLVLTYLVHRQQMALPAVVACYALHPYRVLGLKPPHIAAGQIANLTIFDPIQEWVVDPARFLSKSKNTPFQGYPLKGKPLMTINKQRMFLSSL